MSFNVVQSFAKAISDTRRSFRSMFNMSMNVRSVASKCIRSIRALAWRSKALDFTQQTTEAEKALAYGLWDCYNINLPDTPRRMAMVINQILKEKGYQINER